MFRHSLRLASRSVKLSSLSPLSITHLPGFIGTARSTPSPMTKLMYSTTTTAGTKAPEQVEQLSTREYHRMSDEYLETLVDKLEELSELYPQIDAEYSQGVLTLELPPVGTYVINKQPPNKQIWISSPLSGPDRFDPIDDGWVSLRSGELLGDVLRREVSEALGSDVSLEGL